MTKSTDHDSLLDEAFLEDVENDEPPASALEKEPREPKRVTIRRPSGEGYGRPISTEPCSFCHRTGIVENSRGRVTCIACDGIGTKGGAGKGRHPITLDLVRPYRTHMEEKPLEN